MKSRCKHGPLQENFKLCAECLVDAWFAEKREVSRPPVPKVAVALVILVPILAYALGLYFGYLSE